MTGQCCIVCDNMMKRDPSCFFHHFLSVLSKKKHWLKVFGIEESFLQHKPNARVCARHFPGGMSQKTHKLIWVNGLLLLLKRNN